MAERITAGITFDLKLTGVAPRSPASPLREPVARAPTFRPSRHTTFFCILPRLAKRLYMQILQMFQALANDRRQQILAWLKDPEAHFPPQVDGDLVKDGVCACSIADKLGISQPTLSEHMRVLASAGLVQAKRTKKWIFYKRNETEIRKFKKVVMSEI